MLSGMTHVTCPLFDELEWLGYRFDGREHATAPVPVFTLKQTHSDTVITTNDVIPDTGADAVITDQPNIALAIRTADCVPILLVCTQTKLIAAIHAGWAGALNQITAKTIERMIAMGASPPHIRAAVGPSIHQESFPFGVDLYERFITTIPYSAHYFQPWQDRYRLDVAGIVMDQLRAKGVNQIWQHPVNTFTDPGFYSYRRREADPASEKGRNLSLIYRK